MSEWDHPSGMKSTDCFFPIMRATISDRYNKLDSMNKGLSNTDIVGISCQFVSNMVNLIT